MKIFLSTDIKKLDAYTIENEPIASIDLMERAAKALTEAITKRWDNSYPMKVFAGPGNNGGDALAVARLLAAKRYSVQVFLFNTAGNLSENCEANKERLLETENVLFSEITTKFDPPALTAEDIVIDGLFGSGLNKSLNGGFAAVVKYINSSPSTVVSIDIPSGLMGEDNTYNLQNHIIRADLTLSLQLPKLAFLFVENQEIVGEWELLDIKLNEDIINDTPTNYEIIEEGDIRKRIKPRKRFAHKGNFGHGLLIAGSYGMAGASVLAAKACLRSGVGLLTVHIPVKNNDILQTAVPEAMVQHDIHDNYFVAPVETDDYQAIAIGPGLGRKEETAMALSEQLRLCTGPVILDADALNLLSEHRNWLTLIPKGSILTPHPKEMDRLVGKCHDSFVRLTKACEMAANFKVYIILKGAYSATITPEGKCYFNPTGNPGMATAGSGDVLTGIALALLAQGYSSEDTCKISTYVHGLAGDLAARELGEISITSGDIIDYLPAAWTKLI